MPAERVIGFVDDLIFSSRIESAATALGARWQKVGSLAEAHAACEEARAEGGRVAVVFIDLGWRAGDAVALARDLRSDPALLGAPLVAFGSHVNAERLELARAAGCDLALPNSALASSLLQILKRYLG